MTHISRIFGSAAIAAFLSIATLQYSAQADRVQDRSDAVRMEVSEAMEAVEDFSAEQRDEAVAAARDALERLDAEIEHQEETLRENWSDMSAAARESARDGLRDLRAARNELGERFGALQSGAKSAWDELKAGFAKSWSEFADAWKDSDS